MRTNNRRTTIAERKFQTQDRLRKKLASKGPEKKICLTMIVKNEAKNMPRLLDSVKSVIDMISIVDTGSEDNTKEVILNWSKKNNIPATVHNELFKNFSYNRTHSVKVAKDTYKNADYFLLSDADFVWEVSSDFNKSLLVDHKYMILQYNKLISYWNVRLLSADVDWECVGVTHEYWQQCKTQTNYSREIRSNKLNSLKINDKEDGGCKTDKFERDEKLLREGLSDPDTPEDLKTRYTFYLAQTLKDVQKYLLAIEYYKKRIARKGWEEEIYYSKYQIGFCYEKLAWNYKEVIKLLTKENLSQDEISFVEKWNPDKLSPLEISIMSKKCYDDASKNYLKAYNYRKSRAEALYYCTKMYRTLEMHDKAFELAVIGKKIKYPQDTLFVQHECYDYLFDMEIVLNSKIQHDLAKNSYEMLMNNKNTPTWAIDMIKHHVNNSQ